METSTASVGKFLNPEAIIAQLEILSGCLVADLGCGPGYFSLPFAKIVGETGVVHAFDVLPQALETVESRAKFDGLSNIKVARVNLEKEGSTKLEDNSMDWVIIKDVLFQNQKKDVIINEACRILKPAGRVIVIEWNQNEMNVGPAAETRIEMNMLKQMFENHSFKIEKDIDAGDFHYAFLAVK